MCAHEPQAPSASLRPGRSFYFLWCGESLAIVGTALMEFALGVWVYSHTGSAVAFANVVLAATLPAVIFLPWPAGWPTGSVIG
ncbi:hypothetical protein QNM99_19675 [Pseudomonas sp. PCH446]